MDLPSLVDVLSEFIIGPHKFLFDATVYRETFEWAKGEGEPVPYFSADETPVLCWMARIQDDEDGIVFLTPSGITLFS